MIWFAVLSEAMLVKPTMSQKKMVVSLNTFNHYEQILLIKIVDMLNLRFWDLPSLHLFEDRRRQKGTKQLLSLQSLLSE